MRGLWLLCTYPLLRQRPLRVPALRRATLKSAKWPNAFCPNPSVPRLGSACPHHRSCSVGPPRSAIPGRVAANPASCRITHCAKPAFGQRGLTGPLGSRSKAKSRSKARETSLLRDLLILKRSRGSLLLQPWRLKRIVPWRVLHADPVVTGEFVNRPVTIKAAKP